MVPVSPRFYLKAYIGENSNPSAVPEALARRLVSAEITVSDESPSGFQLVFLAQPFADLNDYDLMQEELLDETNHVMLEVIENDDQNGILLMNGLIVTKELDQAAGRVTVTGEDVSIKMSLFELAKSYPEKTDSAIATEVLGRYSSLGFTPKVVAPANEVAPVTYTPQQLATDLDYLQHLAERNNCRFYIKFDGTKARAAATIAYWGPVERDGDPQPALTSAVLYGNVASLSPSYEPLSPVLYYGSTLTDGDSGKESVDTPFSSGAFSGTALAKSAVAVADFASLGTDPESLGTKLATLKIKGKYMRHQALASGTVATAAQALADRPILEAAVVEGELDTAKYGHILQVPGIVGVRGAGKGFDGDYYVKSVTHKMNLVTGDVSYMQSFKLVREGLEAEESTVDTE